jgi:hypothetical protein
MNPILQSLKAMLYSEGIRGHQSIIAMKKAAATLRATIFSMFLASFLFSAVPGYQSKHWTIRDRESYPARLASEGVTIAVEPLYRDAMAGQVFDTDDMVTRGIMPLAIIIFNDNDFPVEIDGLSIELIHGNSRLKSMAGKEAAYRSTKKDKSWFPQPVLRVPQTEQNQDALSDFEAKFLGSKIVGPHAKGGGFLYIYTRDSIDIISLLSKSVVYIPNVFRLDNQSRMMFFEIDINIDMTNGK